MISTINNAIAKKREDGEKGFTLIELLVVILIIGVLAAIAIPAFLNQRQGAWKSQVESDLKNAAIAAEQFAVDNNGSYAPTGTGAPSMVGTAETTLDDYGFNATQDVEVTVIANTTRFVLVGAHDQLDEFYVYDSDSGAITETDTAPTTIP
ncbi:prepilin-type N-terminal cleavage/methylation domain-containing protein [Salinibacterium sp. dk2585]|uniref:type IV pilin protein n=1 Tax=unclassified Salinibacterium TaxID=2632331 RepID=UPI0011C248E4|nr:prepilin-type N-terminal cleavage/methylation domain-containing protein [Salinibacterium sp. dk2585]TXK55672.1 prepilin-type N-terminal cleavage/methylation domain-containing protein [Salinibacterium sp. dk5596]